MAVEGFRRVYDDWNTAGFGFSIQRFQNIESVYVVHSQIEYDQLRLALARHAQASGGTEGLRMARECKPELIVLDLGMDDVNGFDVLEALNREPKTSGIPVVIYTSKTLDSHEYSRLSSAVDVIKSIM